MKTQQAAEREEQQRIKDLVLKYDMSQESTDTPAGDPTTSLHPSLSSSTSTSSFTSPFETLLPNPNHSHENAYPPPTGPERHSGAQQRSNHSTRAAPRARKLQLSDVDSGWYAAQRTGRGRSRSARGRGRG